MDKQRLLVVREAARYLGVTVGTLYLWARSGRIASVKFGKGTKSAVRFQIEDLDDFIAKSKHTEKKEAGNG